MLIVKLQIKSPKSTKVLDGEIYNVSNLAATSNYDFCFDGRRSEKGKLLVGYPRWSESVRALVARCLGITSVTRKPISTPKHWKEIQVDIGIRPGGWGQLRPISMATMIREQENVAVGYAESTGLTGFIDHVKPRELYEDPWSLAEHALRVSTFGSDHMDPPSPIDLPVYKCGDLSYIRVSDIPEPTRSVFAMRMKGSGMPFVPGHHDAIYVWDWQDFLNGAR